MTAAHFGRETAFQAVGTGITTSHIEEVIQRGELCPDVLPAGLTSSSFGRRRGHGSGAIPLLVQRRLCLRAGAAGPGRFRGLDVVLVAIAMLDLRLRIGLMMGNDETKKAKAGRQHVQEVVAKVHQQRCAYLWCSTRLQSGGICPGAARREPSHDRLASLP